jgi:mono/diheme cytochrome c family protein
MNDTLFYVFGIGLTLLALVVSALGLRNERFPATKGMLALGIAIFVVGVGATTTFAWLNAEDEQAHLEAERAAGELPTPAEVVEAEATGEDAGTEEGEAPTEGEPPEEPATAAEGEALFVDQGCASCHSLQAVPAATGEVGPNLDEALRGQSAQFIETSIVDPEAEIAPGYEPQMPANFGEEMTPEQIGALVDFLVESTR